MEKKTVDWVAVMSGWDKVWDSYYLIECSVANIKEVHKGFQGLALYIKLKRQYGENKVAIITLPRDTAMVLYNDEIQD